MSDDFDGIFDDLTPEDFAFTTTAVLESGADTAGVDGFEEFVASQIKAVRTAFAQSRSGILAPIAALQSDTVFRLFGQITADETIGDLVPRLTEEARVISAKWTFVTLQTMGATIEVGGTMGAIGSSENLKHTSDMTALGMTKPIIYWYAANTDGGGLERRQGFLTIVGIGRLEAESEEADPNQPSIYDRILRP